MYIASILVAKKSDAASIATHIYRGGHVESMREKKVFPDELYSDLEKGEESLRQLAKRYNTSVRTIRRRWDEWQNQRKAWKRDDLAVIKRDLEAPLSMNTWENRFLPVGQTVRVVNVRDKDADVSVEYLLNTLIVPLDVLRKIRKEND